MWCRLGPLMNHVVCYLRLGKHNCFSGMWPSHKISSIVRYWIYLKTNTKGSLLCGFYQIRELLSNINVVQGQSKQDLSAMLAFVS